MQLQRQRVHSTQKNTRASMCKHVISQEKYTKALPPVLRSRQHAQSPAYFT